MHAALWESAVAAVASKQALGAVSRSLQAVQTCFSWPVPWGPWVLSPDPVREAAGPGQDPGTCCFEAGGTPAGASHAVKCEVASGTLGCGRQGPGIGSSRTGWHR